MTYAVSKKEWIYKIEKFGKGVEHLGMVVRQHHYSAEWYMVA